MLDDNKMNEILNYLRAKGESHDTDIAEDIGMSVSRTRTFLAELADQGEVVTCLSVRFENNRKITGTNCRLSGVAPSFSPGRRSRS